MRHQAQVWRPPESDLTRCVGVRRLCGGRNHRFRRLQEWGLVITVASISPDRPILAIVFR